jgi:hypothetical protein
LLAFIGIVSVGEHGTPLAIAPGEATPTRGGQEPVIHPEEPMKKGTRQAIVSAAMFAGLLLMLVSVDTRVRERFREILTGGDGVSSLGDRTSDLGGVLVSAVRHQSIENAPLLVFASVGAVLFVFMLKT